VPVGVSFEQVAPGTEGAHYALAFIRHAGTHAGQDVLVYGATGGIGSAAVQLCKSLGVTVTAVCAAENLALVKSLGADRVVDYTAGDFTKDEQTYDAVFDAVGKSSFGRCKRLLKPGGVYVSSELGPWAQNLILALLTPLLHGRKVKFPFPQDNQAIVRHLRNLIESEEFKPVIDRRYPLDQIVDAYRYVETGQKIGNVVIAIPPKD
jgi:NADPH:quinone reductase-like Zn-dependent oxidoreductase